MHTAQSTSSYKSNRFMSSTSCNVMVYFMLSYINPYCVLCCVFFLNPSVLPCFHKSVTYKVTLSCHKGHYSLKFFFLTERWLCAQQKCGPTIYDLLCRVLALCNFICKEVGQLQTQTGKL